MTEKTYYEVLGVEPTASAKEIRTAAARLLDKYHPDHINTLPPEFVDLANELTKDINAAYDVLKNPQKRADYDRYLAQQHQAEANQQQQAKEEHRRQEEECQQREQQWQAEQERRRREAEARAAEEQRKREEERQQREDQWKDVRVDPPKPPATKIPRSAVILVLVLLLSAGGVWWYFTHTPMLSGKSLKEAADIAARNNFTLKVSHVEPGGKWGTIVAQENHTSDTSPYVNVTISGGEPTDVFGNYVVPDVRGLPFSQACKALMDNGLNPIPHYNPKIASCAVDVDQNGRLVATNDDLKARGTDPLAGGNPYEGTNKQPGKASARNNVYINVAP